MPSFVAVNPTTLPPPINYLSLRRQQKQLRNYLTQLARAEGPARREFWEQQIAGTFLGNPAQGEELELLEQHFDFPEDPDRTKAMTAFWAMRLLSEREIPENTDELVQMIYQAIYQGGRLIPNSYFDRVIISDYNVTEITKTITKLTLLRYLALNLASVQRFIHHHPEEVTQHYPLLLELNDRWVTNDAATFSDVIERPYDYIGYEGAPWSRIPAPIPPRRNHVNGSPARPRSSTRPLTPWQQLWQAYRDESPQGDFNFLLSFYRTNKFFCSLKKRTKEPVTHAPFWTRLFYRIIFWLNVTLVLDTIYYQFWVLLKTTLKVSFDYIMGKPQQTFLSVTPAKKWCELFLTIIFAPFILLIPLVLGLISIPFNCLYLLLQKCFHDFLEAYPDVTKIVKALLTSIESWIKFNLFVYYLKQWSQFLGAFITLPQQLVFFAGPGSVIIGIGVSCSYLLVQLWEKNFDFQSVLDDSFATLVNTVIDDPLTHLVSVAALIVTPATFLCLVALRIIIGLVTGRIFRSTEPDEGSAPDGTPPRNTQNEQAARLNQRLNHSPRRSEKLHPERHVAPILHRRVRSKNRETNANTNEKNTVRRSSRLASQ